jgi:prepilin signal peptidase PulO-like enzyme (type II secretory pathway)
LAAWAILIALAAFQAYAQRFVVGPDGVSYLDLSDAIVTGNWSRLLNLYWSPFYPALIGVGRAITGVGARNEIPLVHAVNVACFIAMLVRSPHNDLWQ